MAYTDVAGRINGANILPEEWALLEKAYQLESWFLPTDEDWLAVRGVLALVDIRRGYKPIGDDNYQLGVANLRINGFGEAALLMHRQGERFFYGNPLSAEDFEELVFNDPIVE